MKLHCSKILLFLLPLNILVTSLSNVHSKNKPYITPHTSTTSSRVLSECDIRSSIYDNDADMKSVKEIFDRQTSQRFEEYEERMKGKRQKRKEERDKNIQEIIEKDRMDKSLAEKVEKCCLICGCGLGGVAAGVGIIGPVAVNEWTKAAITTATELAKEAAEQAGVAAAAKAFKSAVIEGIEREFGVSTDGVQGLKSLFTANTYNDVTMIARAINSEYNASSCLISGPVTVHPKPICSLVNQKSVAALEVQWMTQGKAVSTYEVIETGVENIVSDAKKAAGKATEKAIEEAIKSSTAGVQAKYASCQTAIIASVVALLIIVLVMIIIYLVLRYRRKKKMNKKAHYTKLLNQ